MSCYIREREIHNVWWDPHIDHRTSWGTISNVPLHIPVELASGSLMDNISSSMYLYVKLNTEMLFLPNREQRLYKFRCVRVQKYVGVKGEHFMPSWMPTICLKPFPGRPRQENILPIYPWLCRTLCSSICIVIYMNIVYLKVYTIKLVSWCNGYRFWLVWERSWVRIRQWKEIL